MMSILFMTIPEQIILAAAREQPADEEALNALTRRLVGETGKGQTFPNKTDLLLAYHKLRKRKKILPRPALEKLLTRRAVRSRSGVAVITSLVKPYPCPGLCVYCPLDERMPKSYLSDEPAAARALRLKFDPYEQMARRIEALEGNGHPADKIELIIKGGTWNAYPLAYQYWFVLESFRGANEADQRSAESAITVKDRMSEGVVDGFPTRAVPTQSGSSTEGVYHDRTTRREKIHHAKAIHQLTEHSPLDELRKALRREQQRNERARHRLIGLTLETRPDCITPKSLWQMRELGCTRVELGVQHTDDAILALTKRGHNSARAKQATKLLKDFGFKTDYHLMPQLPGATPEADLAMLREIFSNPDYRPDMIKIYPCTVVPGSELYEWWQQGRYRAYPTEELIRILKIFKSQIVPRYCRISRLIRDIPGQYIKEGNKITNLRQVIQEQLRQAGLRCPCLRCREVGHQLLSSKYQVASIKPRLFADKYEASGGTEYFLSFEDARRRVVFAFCRLRLGYPTDCELPGQARSRQTSSLGAQSRLSRDEHLECLPRPSDQMNQLRNDIPYPAYLRELHTYGQLVSIGAKNNQASQHTGLGKRLVREAEAIARAARVDKLAVIAGVGVRDYYRRLGYRREKTYMVKKI
ncbi:MAG: tRNA uridine(34) 5-carboxymethylaminomethyl modification radical SAM/GNAT enzyme Elp3 [Candidatus Magasanikbacteria bacterium]|nr:tRNA uridine(34) 5-carboxymethylaminomethyl modification radical SAM/GNAT enzyme Elp3 [Candidatus Magasanikbacteria bacterium]